MPEKHSFTTVAILILLIIVLSSCQTQSTEIPTEALPTEISATEAVPTLETSAILFQPGSKAGDAHDQTRGVGGHACICLRRGVHNGYHGH